jgi:hypothetical protein
VSETGAISAPRNPSIPKINAMTPIVRFQERFGPGRSDGAMGGGVDVSIRRKKGSGFSGLRQFVCADIVY